MVGWGRAQGNDDELDVRRRHGLGCVVRVGNLVIRRPPTSMPRLNANQIRGNTKDLPACSTPTAETIASASAAGLSDSASSTACAMRAQLSCLCAELACVRCEAFY